MSKLSKFVATHVSFDDSIYPKSYIILSSSLRFYSSIHKTIYISGEFTVKNFELYSEGCHIHYLYVNQNFIKDYIIFYHYRRFFDRLINASDKYIINLIDQYGCIVPEPEHCDDYFKCGIKNMNEYVHRVFNNITLDIIKDIIEKDYPQYVSSMERFYDNENFYNRNICGMKKNNYIEMCSFCFDVLQKYTEYCHKNNIRYYNIWVPARQCSYLLELLTNIFYFYKFDTLHTESLRFIK